MSASSLRIRPESQIINKIKIIIIIIITCEFASHQS